MLSPTLRQLTCCVSYSAGFAAWFAVGLLGFPANSFGQAFGQTFERAFCQADEVLGDQQSIAMPVAFVSAVVIQSTEAEPEERDLDAPWETFRPSGMDASFEMPKAPKLKKRSFTPVSAEPAITVSLHQCVLGRGDMMFVAGWHDLHTIPRNARQQNDILSGAIRTSVANVLGAAGKVAKVKLERYPGRQISYRFTAAKEVYRVIEQVYLVGARQYQFRVLAKIDRYDDEAAQRFFDSVKLLDPDNDLPPRPRNRKKQR